MDTPHQVFTAAQIAQALNSHRGNLRSRVLKDVGPAGTILVRGIAAAAWRYRDLPPDLLRRLDAEAARRGYDSGLGLLAAVASAPVPVESCEPALSFDPGDVRSHIECVEDRAHLDVVAREWIWRQVLPRCRELELAQGQAEAGAQIRSAMAGYLFRELPGLARTAGALRRSLRRMWADWRARRYDPDALPDVCADRRPQRSGHRRRRDFTEDLRLIRERAVHGVSMAASRRFLEDEGKLSPEFVQCYPMDRTKKKSYLPATVRSEVKNCLELGRAFLKGEKSMRDYEPKSQRDWTGEVAEWWSGDDVTFNSYFVDWDEDGKAKITRGECLIMVDAASNYPLGFMLIAGNYNSAHVRQLVLHSHDAVGGLPRKGFYFENSVWRARLIGGPRRGVEIPMPNVERGLKDVKGLQVRHTKGPGSKPIENALLQMENRMRTERGYVGFNERLDAQEFMQTFLNQARRHPETATKHLYTMEEWRDRITSTLEYYANDPQNGRMNPGVSPAVTWNRELTTKKALMELRENERYLLSTHRVPASVKHGQVTITIRGHRLVWTHEDLAPWDGRNIWAHYNIEYPNLLTISDLHRTNFLAIHKYGAPAMSATKEQHREIQAPKAALRRHAKVLFGHLRHSVQSRILDDRRVDGASAAFGEFQNRVNRIAATAVDEAEVEIKEIKRILDRQGWVLQPGYDVDNPRDRKMILGELRAEAGG